MDNPFNLYLSVLLAVTGSVTLLVAALVWQLRHTRTAIALSTLLLALAWWSLTYALFWAGAPGPIPYFWLDITYLGALSVPPVLLVFALQFARLGHWCKPPLLRALAFEPLMVLVLMWSDPWHDLFFAGKRSLNTGVIMGAGPVFWFNVVYSYGLILLATLLLLHSFLNSHGIYRKQAGMSLVGVLLPWAGNFLLLIGLSPLPNADITPFSFSLAALAFAYALLRYRLLDIVPIARHTLIETMSDGVLVLDAHNRLLDINPVARAAFGVGDADVIGRPADQVLSLSAEIRDKFYAVNQTRAEIVVGAQTPQWLDVQVSPLYNQRQKLIGRLIVWRDISALKRVQAELLVLSRQDSLTKVHNRRYFIELAEAAVSEARRQGSPLSLALLDVDNFKQINDSFGHAAGDKALVAMAEVCRAYQRAEDVFARLGGDEFMLLLPGVTVSQACEIVDRLRQAVAALTFQQGESSFSITTSWGVAELLPEDSSLDVLMSRADYALYQVKQHGRNGVAAGRD